MTLTNPVLVIILVLKGICENWPPTKLASLKYVGMKNWPPSSLLLITEKSKVVIIIDYKQFIALLDLIKNWFISQI